MGNKVERPLWNELRIERPGQRFSAEVGINILKTGLYCTACRECFSLPALCFPLHFDTFRWRYIAKIACFATASSSCLHHN